MVFSGSLARRYGHARKPGWMTASVRTKPNDKAANSAYVKAKKEKDALEVSWSRTMSALAAARTNGTEVKTLESAAHKFSEQADEQGKIIAAAQRYAQLPKEGY